MDKTASCFGVLGIPEDSYFNYLPDVVKSNSISCVAISIFSNVISVPVISGIVGSFFLAHGSRKWGHIKSNPSQQKRRNLQAKLEMLAGWTMILFALYYATPMRQNSLKIACEENLRNCQANLKEFHAYSHDLYKKFGGSLPG